MTKIIGCVLAGILGPALLAGQTSASGAGASGGTVSLQQLGAQTQSAGHEGPKAGSPNGVPGETVQAGSILYAELDKSVDAKKAKVGDPVVAKLQQPLLSRGKIMAPRGAKVIGHVTQVQARTKEHPKSELGLLFDHLALKDGSQVPVVLILQAISARNTAAQLLTPSDPSMQGPMNAAGMPGRTGNPGILGSGSSTMDDGFPATAGGMSDAAGPKVVHNADHVSASSHGVLGISNVEMADGGQGQGSLITSDKKNVKLESGNELVLRSR